MRAHAARCSRGGPGRRDDEVTRVSGRGRPRTGRRVPRDPDRGAREAALLPRQSGALDRRGDLRDVSLMTRDFAPIADRLATRDRAAAGDRRVPRAMRGGTLVERRRRRGRRKARANARRRNSVWRTPAGVVARTDRQRAATCGRGDRTRRSRAMPRSSVRAWPARRCRTRRPRSRARGRAVARSAAAPRALLRHAGRRTCCDEALAALAEARGCVSTHWRDPFGGWAAAQDGSWRRTTRADGYFDGFAEVWQRSQAASPSTSLVTWPDAPHSLRADSRAHPGRGAARSTTCSTDRRRRSILRRCTTTS